MVKANEIRQIFLDYFAQKGHTVVPSSSLVPHGDPTLLFTNAGMVQFKDVFLGREKRPYSRATTAQKCVRAGGKHNDLDSVGRTARHHTFFEMLGNFSFGDYFKREAIAFAWELLTEKFKLPKERLWITIYQDDDEAFKLWQEVAGVPAKRIIRLGEKDNFWAMGDTGPCGPCSEIHYDRGEEFSCGPNCGLGQCECDRWLEIWNLVFMQYNRDEKGNLTPLPRPSIDTGMGLERIASVLQGVNSNYDTDLLRPLITFVEERTGETYYPDQRGFPFRVIADHARSCTFLVADGVLPSNEGRGYVLRRILRRAVRFSRNLGINRPFLHEMVEPIADLMGEAYPEVKERAGYIGQVIRQEEERFLATLSEASRVAQDIVNRLKESGGTVIAGEDAFQLYDTYGFPLDLTEDLAAENGLTVDRAGFERAMEEQRERARAARGQAREWEQVTHLAKLLADHPPTKFVGYDELETEARVLAIIHEGELAASAWPGQEVAVLLDRTPFYPEGGGQVSDQGEIVFANGSFKVFDCQKLPDGKILHRGQVEGQIGLGGPVTARVDHSRRQATAKNHSATHLLHQALRQILGEHVHQSGSLVEPGFLRFDFSHFTAPTVEELKRVEDLVNAKVLEDLPVQAEEMPLEEARARGAMALFGEKYGELVRVVSMGDFSRELCGGTHVHRTGEIGLFKITKEESVGAGLRRVTAITGLNSLTYLRVLEDRQAELTALLKSQPEDLAQRVAELQNRLKEREREIEKLTLQLARRSWEELLARPILVDGIKVVSGRVAANNMEGLRNILDQVRDRLGSGVVILGAVAGEKVNLVAAVSRDLVPRGLDAGKILREAAQVVGGSGGGRPEMAQAGGKDPNRLEEALERAVELVKRALEPGAELAN